MTSFYILPGLRSCQICGQPGYAVQEGSAKVEMLPSDLVTNDVTIRATRPFRVVCREHLSAPLAIQNDT